MSQIISLRKLIITEFIPENKDMKFSFRHMKPFRYGNTKVPPLKTPKFSPENIMKILTELRDRILTTVDISKELIDLISVQKNLKNLYMLQLRYEFILNTNLSNLQELKLYCNNYDLWIFNYDLVFDRFKNSNDRECYEKAFTNLNNYLSTNRLNEFLENNGRNKRSVLRNFFKAFPFLESIRICYHDLNSMRNSYLTKTSLVPEELELLLESWKSRVPQKPLSLVITGYHTFIENDGNIKE
uniref:Uncharacterized protein n=1 Tax=Rhizophagus irregularis (strain DAOM 181602 / DAOM 197198 / MUCL 43194) TaxID=747089 RepID=U9UHM7_RHIID